MNIHAMRMGPGKHLKGLTLVNGIIKPEEVRALAFMIDQYMAHISLSILV